MENMSKNTTTSMEYNTTAATYADGSNNTESQFSVIDIINMMLARWWLIVILAIVAGSGTYIYTKIVTIPTYNSTGTLYINTQAEQKSDDVNTSAITGARTLMPTYIEILQSKPFLQTVSDDIMNRYSFSEIQKMTNYTAVDDTNLISISVDCIDSHDAYLICSSIANNAPAEITRVFEGGSVKLINSPEEAASPNSSPAIRNGLIGLIAGIALAMVIIFLINLFDTRVKSSEELTGKYKLPILGEIPNLHKLQ